MKHVIKLRLFRGNSTSAQILHLSSLAKSKPSKKSPNYEDQTETPVINSLFKEITDILGSIDTIPNKHPSEISLPREPKSRVNESTSSVATQLFSHCRQPVCENASVITTTQTMESFSYLEHTQKSFVSENDDLSSIVNEIADIVISGDGMERGLESVKLHLKPEIVEKVLKRCFKVPHLAFRFFSWIKGRDEFCHTVETYNTMLCIAGEARDFGVVENLVEEMERNSCQMDIKTWTILIMIYGKAKLIGKALLCFEKMRKLGYGLDVGAYRILIRSLCNADKGEIAFEIYKEMVKKEMVLDWSLYKMLVNCLAKSGNATALGLVADDMIRVSQIPERDVCVYVLKSYCVAGRIRKALEYIRELKNKEIPIDSEHYEILVKGLCRAGRVSDALEIVEIMKKSDFVNAKIYGIIINGYLRRKELSKALEQFQTMKELGHCPSASTYTELMQHLFDRNEYQTGCQLYNEMIERVNEMDSVAMMAVVAGHVRQDNISGAWKVFNTMKDDGLKPTRKSYMIFLKELYKISRTDEMLKVLTEMKASRIYIHDETFRWVMSLMEKKGDIDGMQRVKQLQGSYTSRPIEEQVQEISELHKRELSMESNYGKVKHKREDALFVKPIVKAYSNQDLKEISGILSSSTDWPSVKEALEKTIVQFTPELVTEVLHTCSIYGNVTLNFFSWVGTQTGYHHTSETYNMAMKISGRGKDFKHMRDLFYQMRRSGCLATTDTWAIMIMQYGRMGMTKIALNIFSEMKTSGFNPKGSTYKFLIICLCGKKGRKVDEAIKTFREMIHARYIPDKELVETYIGCLCEVDKLPEARWCIDSLCKLGFSHTYTYSTYVRALCRAGKMEEALSVVNEFRDKGSSILDQSTYGSLVHGLLRKGRLEEATAKIESLKQAGIKPTVHVYTSLMVYYFREQQIEKAVEIFEKMEKEGVEPTIVTYSSLIRGYMNTGRDGDAWDVFNSLKLRGVCPDFKTYSMFISCLCKAGKSEDGLKLLYEMLESRICPSTINFRTVMFGLNREGKYDLAQAVLKQKSELKSKRKFPSL